jgi:hypothetical protein
MGYEPSFVNYGPNKLCREHLVVHVCAEDSSQSDIMMSCGMGKRRQAYMFRLTLFCFPPIARLYPLSSMIDTTHSPSVPLRVLEGRARKMSLIDLACSRSDFVRVCSSSSSSEHQKVPPVTSHLRQARPRCSIVPNEISSKLFGCKRVLRNQ